MDNLESQEMELLALKNIYEEKDLKIDETNPPSGRFSAQVRLPQPFFIRYRSLQGNLESRDNEVHVEESFPVEHLPPINLSFRFPKTYPLQTCPAFLLTCSWLTLKQMSDLCKYLESVWESNRDAIMFTWFQFLQVEVLDFFQINDSLDITELLKFRVQDNVRAKVPSNDDIWDVSGAAAAAAPKEFTIRYMKTISELVNIKPSVSGGSSSIDARAFNDVFNGRHLIQLLKDHDEKKKEEIFQSRSHDCDICFVTKEGFEFMTFKPCKHSFCIQCVKQYFEGQIDEGNVRSLNCLDVECNYQADGSVVRQIVSKEYYEKYDRILLARTLEDMQDMTICPRKMCQYPVLLDSCGRMGTCIACDFVFCALCNMAYHGVAPCSFKKDKLALYKEYTNANSTVKAEIEKRYGKRFIKAMVEDILSEDYKSSNCKTCPHCKASIEKSDGCNKMTCYKCGTYFCYLCEARLKPSDPYEHFRNSYNCTLFNADQIEDFNIFDMDFDFEPGEFLF